MPQRLYIIAETPSGPCKIGIARDPERRRRELQTGNPRALTIARVYETRRPARTVERMVHDRLAASRLSGEWFLCTVAAASAAVAAVTGAERRWTLSAWWAGVRLSWRMWWRRAGL